MLFYTFCCMSLVFVVVECRTNELNTKSKVVTRYQDLLSSPSLLPYVPVDNALAYTYSYSYDGFNCTTTRPDVSAIVNDACLTVEYDTYSSIYTCNATVYIEYVFHGTNCTGELAYTSQRSLNECVDNSGSPASYLYGCSASVSDIIPEGQYLLSTHYNSSDESCSGKPDAIYAEAAGVCSLYYPDDDLQYDDDHVHPITSSMVGCNEDHGPVFKKYEDETCTGDFHYVYIQTPPGCQPESSAYDDTVDDYVVGYSELTCYSTSGTYDYDDDIDSLSDDDGLSDGAIAAIIIVSIFAVAVIMAAVYYFCFRKGANSTLKTNLLGSQVN